MGKKGTALRVQRAAVARYTFTGAELAVRDRQVLERFRQDILNDCTEKLEKQFAEMQKDWDEFAEEAGRVKELEMLCLLAASIRVLIEKFNWKAIPEDGNYDGRNRIYRFSRCLVEEASVVLQNGPKDIRRYCDETYEKYGVKFLFEE